MERWQVAFGHTSIKWRPIDAGRSRQHCNMVRANVEAAARERAEKVCVIIGALEELQECLGQLDRQLSRKTASIAEPQGEPSKLQKRSACI